MDDETPGDGAVRSRAPKSRRQAAEMSTRQITESVLRGRRVVFTYERRPPVSGYVAGLDDFHWMVVDPVTLNVLLVHKALAPVVEIARESSYLEEPNLVEIDRIVSPFRRSLAGADQRDAITSQVATRLQGDIRQ